MDNPQIMQAIYQNMLTSPNSTYLPRKKTPKMAKDNRKTRITPSAIGTKSVTAAESPNRILPHLLMATTITANTKAAMSTLTRKITRNPDGGRSTWRPSTTVLVSAASLGSRRNGLNDHVGPPLCRKYAIPIHGIASILDTSFVYRITDSDKPSTPTPAFSSLECHTPLGRQNSCQRQAWSTSAHLQMQPSHFQPPKKGVAHEPVQ